MVRVPGGAIWSPAMARRMLRPARLKARQAARNRSRNAGLAAKTTAAKAALDNTPSRNPRNAPMSLSPWVPSIVGRCWLQVRIRYGFPSATG